MKSCTSRSRRAPRRLAACLLLLLPACLLPSPAAPTRYFEPALPARGLSARPSADGAALRLRFVRAASHLGAPIVWRSSDVELGAYDDLRWNALPAEFVEQELAQRLFVEQGMTRVSSGWDAPVLDVMLTAFEEQRVPGSHQARVALQLTLTGSDRRTLLLTTVEATAPIEGDDGAAIARAVGRALGEVADDAQRAVRGAIAP